MNILTVYANPNPRSFCHAVLAQFTQGLRDAGHKSEVIDLYAIGFDPVLRIRDAPNWVNESLPIDVLEKMELKRQAIESTTNPVQRLMVRMMLRNKSTRDILKMAWKRRPKDIIEQQEKVAKAQGLALISPIWFVGFPAILKGWIERVYTPGFAFGLSNEGWKGDIKGRIPLLKHEKVLIMSTTLFNEETYAAGLREAMKKVIDDFAFRYPGIKRVEHTYFYAVNGADSETRKSYLQRAYLLGKEYSSGWSVNQVKEPSAPAR
jgi:NAD(P)H dehydrogenase (quinone)